MWTFVFIFSVTMLIIGMVHARRPGCSCRSSHDPYRKPFGEPVAKQVLHERYGEEKGEEIWQQKLRYEKENTRLELTNEGRRWYFSVRDDKWCFIDTDHSMYEILFGK